jgi:hypothetical protein
MVFFETERQEMPKFKLGCDGFVRRLPCRYGIDRNGLTFLANLERPRRSDRTKASDVASSPMGCEICGTFPPIGDEI